ncbi:hypothetical protein F2Q69_00024490 [Brassica cretica]|uniref:Uncharacterized protein n=1 Tax=Brassica cretica TaxID=69181 RepID=A0A8S9Q7Z0_BRACR|nr:hypothetical protein F2Q69_00024490 [Brassica cretica]
MKTEGVEMSETAAKVSNVIIIMYLSGLKDGKYGEDNERRNKDNAAENGNQTSPKTSWDSDQLGLFGYRQKCIEQDQLSTMKHNGYCYSQMKY